MRSAVSKTGLGCGPLSLNTDQPCLVVCLLSNACREKTRRHFIKSQQTPAHTTSYHPNQKKFRKHRAFAIEATDTPPATTFAMTKDEVDPSELFSSPINPSDAPGRPKTPRTPKTPTPANASKDREKEPFDVEEVREAALRRELEGVRNINEVIEGVIGTLEKARGNMGVRATLFRVGGRRC